jgi:hypothetical protein
MTARKTQVTAIRQAPVNAIEKCGAIDLESDLHDACNMAHIAAEMIENLFADKANHLQVTGRRETYFVGDEDVEAMLFAVYEVHKMLKELREKYLASAGLT